MQRLTRGALAEMRTLLLEMRPGALAQIAARTTCWSTWCEATEARTRIAVKLTVADAAAVARRRDHRPLSHRPGGA